MRGVRPAWHARVVHKLLPDDDSTHLAGPDILIGHDPDLRLGWSRLTLTPNPPGDPMTEYRRIIRRYAHELFPPPEEREVRPLMVEVPYLYARAIGLDTWDTGWSAAPWETNEWANTAALHRIQLRNDTRLQALLADALLQGMAGDEAWAWATQRAWDHDGTWIHARATHYGIDPGRIKPYPCGPEPDSHDHVDPLTRIVTRVDGRESECPDCTEPTGDTPWTTP